MGSIFWYVSYIYVLSEYFWCIIFDPWAPLKNGASTEKVSWGKRINKKKKKNTYVCFNDELIIVYRFRIHLKKWIKQ